MNYAPTLDVWSSTTAREPWANLSIQERAEVKYEEAQVRWLLRQFDRADLETRLRQKHEESFGEQRLSFAAFGARFPDFDVRLITGRLKQPFAELQDSRSVEDLFRTVRDSRILRYYEKALDYFIEIGDCTGDGYHDEPGLAMAFPAGGFHGGLVIHNRELFAEGTQISVNRSKRGLRSIARFRDFASLIVGRLKSTVVTDNLEEFDCRIAVDDQRYMFLWRMLLESEIFNAMRIPMWAPRLTSTPSQLLLLSAIADVTTPHGSRVTRRKVSRQGVGWWITSNEEIEARTGLKERTIRQASSQLVDAGVIERKQQWYQGKNRLYLRLVTETLCKSIMGFCDTKIIDESNARELAFAANL